MQKIKETALVWLRNDLRVTDHFGLYNATNKYEDVIAYFCFDPAHYKNTKWGFKKTSAYRAQFLIESVIQVQKDLAEKNITLIIDNQNPVEGIADYVASENIKAIYFQKEWTPEEIAIEHDLRLKLKGEVIFHSDYDQFLFHPEDVPMSLEQLPEVFTQFRKECEKKSWVRKCYPSPNTLNSSNKLNEEFRCPDLQELGLENKRTHPNSVFPFKGGSKEAKNRINHYFWESKKLSFYKNTRNGLLGIDYSSKLSAWLANGSISSREIYWEVVEYEKNIKKNQSTYWLIFELIWRDFFKYISLKHQNKIFQLGGILNKKYEWENDSNILNQWIEGKTKEPFVNANMIELKKTGWMSNRGRQNVASYFSKELYMDWRIGAAYFESLLIDYDVHSNYGNWMYISGVGNDPRDRKFNIRSQAERYDGNGSFQKLWNQQTLFE
jgi:deoxyribodipyrimidine photo-lyase